MRFFIDDDTSRLFVLASSTETPPISIKLSPEQHVALLRHSVDSINSHDLYMVRGADYPLTANARLLSDEDKRYLRKYMPYVFYDLLRHFAGFFGDGQRLSSAMAALREVRVDRRMEYAAPISSRVFYRGHRMPREHVARTHWLLRDLGHAVRDSIRTEDPAPIDEFMEHNVHTGVVFGYLKDDVVAALDRLNSDHGIHPAWVLADCGHFELGEEVREVRVARRTDELWCEACVDTRAAVPMDDNDILWDTRCLYNHSDGEWYTYEEEEEEDDDSATPIFGYSTNVLSILASTPFQSSRTGDFTLGIEFEMAPGRNQSARSAALDVRAALGNDYCIIKHDGSLSSIDGIEVVTVPHRLKTHIEKFSAWTPDASYRAWDTKQCGLHVHIDSRAFSALTLGKFIMFINDEKNKTFIRNIAGRHPLVDHQAQSYCNSEAQNTLTSPSQALIGKRGNMNRYRMVNIQNLGAREARRLHVYNEDLEGRYNTIELRIFRASLKKERLLAQIEFTHACVMFCRVASYRDLNGDAFVAWLKKTSSDYPHLANWYGVRRVAQQPAQTTCTDSLEEIA